MSSQATLTASSEAPKRDSVFEVMAASIIGTAIEFYDNYCYSIAAASYFGMVFFTDVAKQNPFLATLFAFVTFAVSFIARPFGSLLFGHFGDKLGRKKTLVAALLMMGISTFVVGVLPGFDVLGPMSVVLLCVCRACQGLGLAGEWSGAALVATENAPANKRALWGSFPNLGAPLGFFFAYSVNLLLESNLSRETMLAWGWRVPFLLSAVLVVVGMVVRERMSETPVFEKAVKEDRVVKSPLKELVKYWKQVVLGTCAMGITYTLFYLLGTWSLSYGVKTLGFAQTDFLKLELAAVVFFALFIVVGCVQADKRGRRPVLLFTTFLTVVFSFFAPQLLATQNAMHVLLFLSLGFCLMGGLFGPCGAYLPELFPAKVRYSGSGLAYNLASILGGAFAPTIATGLVLAFGIQGVGWYLVAMSVLAFVALLLIKESKDMEFDA